MAMQLRTVDARDAAAITAIFLDCWHLSYGPVMPAELVERMTPEHAASLWERSLLADSMSYIGALDGASTLVGVVGFLLDDEGSGYVGSLYVSPRAQGGGYGRLLLARAEQELRGRGATTARLWVFEQNEPSRRFYERCGWSADGTRETLPEWGVPQIGMSKQL
jgi:GNAT superfamily N-acetyltransferase